METLGYPESTAAFNTSQNGNNAKSSTTLQTSNTTAPTSQTKLEFDAYLS